jgi:hypothetical protein
MNRLFLTLAAFTFAILTPLAHASVDADGASLKEDMKAAARDTGDAVSDAAKAVGHGAKKTGQAIGHGAAAAGHAIADASRNGYQATKKFITGAE